MKYEQIRNLLDEPFRRLTGIKRQTFEKMVQRSPLSISLMLVNTRSMKR